MPDQGTQAKAKRELAFHHTDDFTGFRCRACSWTTPLKRYWAKGEDPPKDVKNEFDAHECKESN